MATVNFELGPWIRMTCPPQWQDLALRDWRAQELRFGSWVLFLGLLPIDRHAFGTLHCGPDMQFVESSSSWLMRAWQHQRIVKADAGGCEVIDHIRFESRIAWLSTLVKPIYTLVFRHRHARLRARYGELRYQ